MKVFKALLITAFFFPTLAGAANYPFTATYSGANEVPPNASTATGTISGVYNDVTNTIYFTVTFSGLGSNTTAGHFHGPAAPGANAGVIYAHTNLPAGVTSGTFSGSNVLTAAQETDLLAGLWYSNIHTTGIPGGEIRAQIVLGAASATVYTFTRTYSGANEVPPNSSTATGTITGAYNDNSNTIFYTINFSGLSANTTAAHFHGPAIPGVNAGVQIAHTGFPAGVMSGNFSSSHVLTATQETDLLAGLWYSNIHTTALPGGEIRAQIFFDGPAFVAADVTCPANITTGTDPDVCNASETFSASATGTPTPSIIYRIGSTVITSPYTFPLGVTSVRVMAINGGGYDTCVFTVTVNDTQGPTISGMDADPDTLWPPNHRMVEVDIPYTSIDNCPGTITCSLTVTSDEPVNGNGQGSGNSQPDWIVIDDHTVKLRAERDGTGDGRTYTITATCRDQYNNTSTSTTTVIVPHDMHGIHPPGGGITVVQGGGITVNASQNPTNSQFNLNITSTNSNEKIEVRVTDLLGRTVLLRTYTGNQAFSFGSELIPGIYFLSVQQAGEVVQMKLVKTR